MEWTRMLYDGLYQFIACDKEENVLIESKLDVTDGKCKELWESIKENYPNASGYRSFCSAYKEGLEDFNKYADRNERRYKNYWR